MPKKRIIFTLLYDNGYFVLSRNFRLQRIGDLGWLNLNYGFENVSQHIDELVILNVSRTDDIDWNKFLSTVSALARSVFVPIAVGGFNHDLTIAHQLLRSGADKLVVNSDLFKNTGTVQELVQRFGRQCVVGSIDIDTREDAEPAVITRKGSMRIPLDTAGVLATIPTELIGEVILRSVQRDGTGQGLDMSLISYLPSGFHQVPLILSGGVGRPQDIQEGLCHPHVSGVATANLLNFIGPGLKLAREYCLSAGLNLASWIRA